MEYFNICILVQYKPLIKGDTVPTTLPEYIIVIAGLFYLTERISLRVQYTVRRRRKKSLKKLHDKLHKISDSAALRVELLWDEEAKRITKEHVQKRQQDGTLPQPFLPLMDPAEFYTRQIKECFMSYAQAQIIKPHLETYMKLAKKVADEDATNDMAEEFTESTDKAKETLRDVGFDLGELNKQLVTI